MGKKVAAVVSLALFLGVTLASCTADDKNWSFVADESYSILSVQCDNPILIKRVQDGDYLKQSGGVKAAGAEEEAAQIRTLNEDSGIGEAENFNVTVKTLQGSDRIKMKQVTSEGIVMAVPNNSDELGVQFVITPDGQQSFLASDLGIWSVDSKQAKRISPADYNTMSYDALAQQSAELYQENIVRWNENVTPDPTSTKLAYISNKHDIFNDRNALYVLDLTTGMESISARDGDATYMLEGWLDPNTLLCMKISEDKTAYVAVPLDEEEVPLAMVGSDPFVYAVQDGVIAYAEVLGSPEIHFARYMGADGLKEIKSVKMGWQTRVRGGNYGFSPDSTKFACLYIPEGSKDTRYVQVTSLTENKKIKIDSLPGDSDFLIEFYWADNETLLVVAGKDNKGIIEQSTWSYDLSGGEKQ
ncbi:hypothetical protein FRZ06_17380 [Anoxybacterium hadale]|uniref:Uncharacterized protein n=1 Tax=Anoxybacterium hadale TaxID=3408580 RepID=A0ACD1AEX0_9FIRM|nr:hypothetical protein FRZ06_17380 [Clostridiales bacterium]